MNLFRKTLLRNFVKHVKCSYRFALRDNSYPVFSSDIQTEVLRSISCGYVRKMLESYATIERRFLSFLLQFTDLLYVATIGLGEEKKAAKLEQ